MFKSPATTSPAAVRSDVITSLWTRLSQAWQRNRTIDQLSDLSDEHLRDIGVDRRDIGQVVDRELARLRRSDLAWHK